MLGTIVALLLIVGGVIGLMYGGFTYTQTTHDAKISWLRDELGLDAVFNCRAAVDLEVALEELCPVGVDVYFDNVGGAISDAVIRRINRRARIVVCGQISQCNLEAPELGPRWLSRLMLRQARVEGFLVSGYAERFPEGRKQVHGRPGEGGDSSSESPHLPSA